MPDQVSFDLALLVRVCLNDPDLRAEITAALEAGPLPVRTPCTNVGDGDRAWTAILRSDRDKKPGDPGFLVRDGHGWISGRLTEVVTSESDASTMSAEQLAEKLGVKVEDLADKLKT